MTRSLLVILLAAVLLAGGTLTADGPFARAAGSCAGGDPALDAEEAAFLTVINDYRARNGQRALVTSPSLNRAAAWMVNDMAAKAYFGHGDSSGRDPSRRAKDCGYPGQAGENLAAGTNWASAQDAFEAWKGSPGHNAKMLSAQYVVVGIARAYNPSSPYGWYWATSFGMLFETAQSPTPAPTAVPSSPATAPAAVDIVLYPGSNLVTWVAPAAAPAAALRGSEGALTAVYTYDVASGQWLRYGPGLPSYVNSIATLERGRAYWMLARGTTVLHQSP